MNELKGGKYQRVMTNDPDKYTGIVRDGKQWLASFLANGKYVYVGSYYKLEEAIEAHDREVINFYGNDAITNKKMIDAGIKNKPSNKYDIIPNYIVEEIPGEIWKKVEGYNDKYLVSNLGRVKTMNHISLDGKNIKEKIVLETVRDRGYKYVNLGTKGNRKSVSVHRLVAIAFIENPNKLATVNHKDTNKANNNAENLEWMTNEDNIKHAQMLGLCKKPIEMNAKLNVEQVKEVKILFKNGHTLSEISKSCKINPGSVWFIINNRTWKHVEI